MNYKKYLCILVCWIVLGSTSILVAENQPYVIKGTIYDEVNKYPVEFASVVIKNLKKKVLTNDKGEFEIQLKGPGEYTVEISAPDLKTRSEVVTLTEETSVKSISVYLELRKVKAASIDIVGKRDIQKVARQTMDQEQLKEIPATMGDSINALASFAGIDQFTFLAGLGPLIIRGADAFSNRYYIDGIPVNSVQHMLGLHSVINNDLIDKIDVFMSAAPVRFGNSALGGVIEINTIDSVKKFGGRFELSAMSANGSVYAPVLKDPKDPDSSVGYWFIGGRYGYLTALLPPILESLTGDAPPLPQYYDYQAKGKYYLDKNNSISILILGFGDTLDNTDPLSADARDQAIADGADPIAVDLNNSLNISTHIQSLSYDYSPSERLINKFKIYSALNETFQTMDNQNPNAPTWMQNVERTANPNIFGAKDELLFKLFNDKSTTRIGAEVTYYDFVASGQGLVPNEQFSGGAWSQFNLTESMFTLVDIDQHSRLFLYSGFLEEKLEFGGFTLAAGLRAEYFENDNLYTIDPRGFASYEFPSDTTISLAAGTYGSFPQTNYMYFSQAPEIAEATGLEVEKGYHYTAGIEQKISKIYNIKLEGFYANWENLFQPAANIIVNGETAMGINSGKRKAYGVEVTLGKDKAEAQNDFYGWINYTWMDGSQKTGLPLEYDPQGNQWINNEYIRNHSLKLVAGYKFGRNTIGGRFRLMSSLPYTPIVGDDGDIFGIGRYNEVYGDRFSEYFPLYHQLDIRFSRTETTKWGKVSWYIEIQNVYNNHVPTQVWKYNQPYESGANPVIDTEQGIGILPSFGVEFQF